MSYGVVSGDSIFVKTSATLEYVEGLWGIERIVLDGIQNHLPADSGGRKISMEYQINGNWVSQEEGIRLYQQGQKVDAIAVQDDGTGFDYRKLELFYSHKPNGKGANGDSRGPAGQFGEGLKMISAACLRKDIELRIRSRDWIAEPEINKVKTDGQVAHQLIYHVRTGQPMITGSRTEFMRPPPSLVEYMNNVGQKVLHFREDVPVLYSDDKGNMIIEGPGDIFVKGIFITSAYREKLMHDYDFNIDDIPRERDHVKENVFGNTLGALFAECSDKGIIRSFLRASVSNTGGTSDLLEVEHTATEWTFSEGGERRSGYGRSARHPQLWKEAFTELFGEKAVLYTDLEHARLARLGGHEILYADRLIHFLGNCGIPVDKDVGRVSDTFLLEEFSESDGLQNARLEVHETSIPTTYRAKKWGPLRIMLDSVSNHLPSDSGGSQIQIQFRTSDRHYHRRHNWTSRKDFAPNGEKVDRILISDDGRGYDRHYLSLLLSSKSAEEVGRFGEGLKLVSTACARKQTEDGDGLKVKFRSADWVAGPLVSERTVGERSVGVLYFQVLTNLPASVRGSRTTFANPDEELVELFRKADDFILPLRHGFEPLHSAASGSLFEESRDRSVCNGSVFNRGVFITESFSDKLLFSYDINTEDLSPDRDNVNFDVLSSSVHSIVSSCSSREVVSKIIERAENEAGAGYLEFAEMHLPANVAEVWKSVFHGLYGEDAVLFTKPDAALEARHKGFNVVELNKDIAETLHRAGVEYDVEVAHMNLIAEHIPYEQLTPEEQAMLARVKLINEVLSLPPLQNEILIYSKVSTVGGRDLTSRIPGFWDGANIHMQRNQLASFASMLRIYQHERGHAESGGTDPQDEFRHFFEYYMAALIGKELKRKEQDPSYEVGVDQFAQWDIWSAAKISQEAARLQARVKELEVELQALKDHLQDLETGVVLLDQPKKPVEPATLLRPDNVVSFHHPTERKTVYVQTNDPELSLRMEIRILEYALLGKRRFTESLSGWIFGKPLPVEHKVDVFVGPRSGGPIEERDLEKLNDRQKIWLLRKVARRERKPGSRQVSATIALDELKRKHTA